MRPEIVAAHLMARSARLLHYIEHTLTGASAMMETGTAEDKFRALKDIATLSSAHAQTCREMMKFATQAASKSTDGKPMNKPPQLAMQINVGAGGSASITPANNGNTQVRQPQ